MRLFDNLFRNNTKTKEEILFEQQVISDGIEVAGVRVANIISEKITSKGLALQFVLEELDAARQGNDYSINFVNNSGFNKNEYIGAMNKTKWSGDESELEHLQLYLRMLLKSISSTDLRVELSIEVVDNIMKKWNLGKYKNDTNSHFLNQELQNILNKLDYNDEKVEQLIKQYSDILPNLIMGRAYPNDIQRMNEFAEHMALASLQGNYKAISYSCFVKHSDILSNYLPIPFDKMDNQTLEFLITLLHNNGQMGFSNSLKRYLQNSKETVKRLASNNKYAQFLMGMWYAFDDSETKGHNACLKERMDWYEKSALNGFLPAIISIGDFYDSGEDVSTLPTDLRKAAYWYRKGAINKNALSAYNLGVMYSQGEGVKQNLKVASLWLSFAYKLNDQALNNQLLIPYINKQNIELISNPDLDLDPELNPYTAELSDVY